MFGLIEVFLFLCVVYYLFGKRTSDMVDLISNRFQGVYDSWNLIKNVNPPISDRLGFTSAKREKELRKEQEVLDHQSELKAREKSLYQLKDVPPPEIKAPIVMSSLGLSCRYCSPGTSEVQLSAQDRRRNVIDVLQTRPFLNPNRSIFSPSYWFPNVAQSLRTKKYVYPEVTDRVLNDDRLKRAIDQATVESVRERREMMVHGEKYDEDQLYLEMERKHTKRASKLLFEMKAKFSNAILQFTSWLVFYFLPTFLSGAILHPGQMDMIKAAMKKCPNTPLIFLPLHRSHIDYILVTFMSLNNNIPSPVVVAGDNLKIPVIGAMLRGLGAFFIKRKIDPVIGKKDVVYRSVLHSYLQNCISAGHNIEFFMEGGRTRTGKPCIPKGGVLSVIIDAFMEGSLEDALLVPVSMNYEKLVDGNFVNEHLGQRKPKETLMSALKVFWKSINSHYGLMRIDFNEPFSLKEIISSCRRVQEQQQQQEEQGTSNPSTRLLQQTKSSTSLFGTDIVEEELRSIVDNVARHVVYDCSTATTVMSSNAVVFLLLHRFRTGVTMDRLAKSLDALRDDLNGKKDLGFTGNTRDVIKYVVDLMGPNLIKLEQTASGETLVKPVQSIEAMIELSYYSNTLMPYYALESVIASVIHILALRDHDSIRPNESYTLCRESILQLALEYCDILRYEFILHKPCQDLRTLLNEVIDRFALKDLVNLPQTHKSMTDLRTEEMYERLVDEGVIDEIVRDTTELSDDNKVILNGSSLDELKIYSGFLGPIPNAYLTVVEGLNGLLGNQCVVESEFYKLCIKQLKENYRSGLNQYGESVSLEMVKNCVKLLEKWSVTRIESDSGVRLIALCDDYKSSEGVEYVYDSIQKFVPTLELPLESEP